MEVKNSEGTVKVTQLYANDKLYVTSAKGGTADVYTISIGTKESTTAIQVKTPSKVLSTSLVLQPQILKSTSVDVFNLTYSNTDRSDIIADLDLVTYAQTVELFVKDASSVVVAGKTTNSGSLNLATGETLWIKVYAQNTTAAPTSELPITIPALSGDANLVAKDPVKYGTSVATGNFSKHDL